MLLFDVFFYFIRLEEGIELLCSMGWYLEVVFMVCIYLLSYVLK